MDRHAELPRHAATPSPAPVRVLHPVTPPKPTMSEMRHTIVRLLSNLGSPREIQQYLKRFSQQDAARFAVVKVGGAVLRDDLEDLVSSLAFLQQVGLTPIVVHGAGPQLDARMQAAGIEKRIVDGLRVTDPATLVVVRQVMREENLRLVEALQAQGVRATSIQSGVFECDLLDAERLGLVGRVVHVDTDGIHAAIKVGSIPVIASLGESGGGQILNVNADWAANELIKELKPYKIVFLTGTGGLLDDAGGVIESINLSSEYAQLLAQPWIHGGMRVKLEQIHDLLMELPSSSSVSITRPSELAKELFTHRGSGTLVRRGERVLVAGHWDALDRDRLRTLIESAFGRRLVPEYFERTVLRRAYVTESYRAAVVIAEGAGMDYLDKFAVLDEAQGEGLGRAVWHAMREAHPRLFWRSRHGNPINAFYDGEAEGFVRQERWRAYWYGYGEPDGAAAAEIQCVLAHCRARAASLSD